MSEEVFCARVLAHFTRQVTFLRVSRLDQPYRQVSSRVRKSFVEFEHDVSGVTIVGLDVSDEQNTPLVQRVFLGFLLVICDRSPARQFLRLSTGNSGPGWLYCSHRLIRSLAAGRPRRRS
jgi:hypothetical protein